MLILLSPLLLAIAAAVRLSSPGPILFRQRIGRDGRRFEMLKFRSMELQPPTPEPTPNNVLTLPTDIGRAASRASTGAPAPAPSSAAPPWTSCRSSSTCCAAT